MKVSTLVKFYLIMFALLFVVHLVFNTPFTVALIGIWVAVGALTILDRRVDPKTTNPNRNMVILGLLLALAGAAIFWLFPQHRDTTGPVIFLTVIVYAIFTVYRWLVDWELPDFHLSQASGKLRNKISELRQSGEEHKASVLEEILSAMTQEDSVAAKSIASKVMTAKTEDDWIRIREMVHEQGVISTASHKVTENEVVDFLQKTPRLSNELGAAITNYVVAEPHRETFRNVLTIAYNKQLPKAKSPKVSVNDQSGLDPENELPQIFPEYDEDLDLWLEEEISAPARSGRRLAILFAALFLLLVLVGIGMSVNIAMLIEPEDPLTAPVPIATATAMSSSETACKWVLRDGRLYCE